MAFTDSFQSEWLKTRRSLATPLVLAGAGFTPVIVIGARLLHRAKIAALSAKPDFWPALSQPAFSGTTTF